jgi:Uma2 family endonuclease
MARREKKPTMTALKPQTRKWTRREYYRMADLGLFDGQRVELIEGTIVQMPPQKNFHVIGIGLVEKTLQAAFGPRFWVRIQAPLHLGPRSAPEPDAAVVPGSPRDYTAADRSATDQPTTALLIVEVSDTTLSYDRGRKASLYARAKIADYWIVNLVHGRLEVRRSPVPDAGQRYGWRYHDVLLLGPKDRIAPLAAPKKRVAVADLLP